MDVFKAQLTRIQQQLAALSATQRMLAGSLVAIMVLTIMLWGRYASSSEMVPVVDTAFDQSMLLEAQRTLKNEGIDAKISGDRVVVSADQVDHAFTALSYAKQLPIDTPHAFEDVLKQTNPFDGEDKSQLIFTHAREMQVAQIISDFPGVDTARVVLNSKMDRHIGDAPVMPSGIVVMKTRQDADVNHLVDSACFTLVRTVPGMETKNVSVVVNGTAHKVHDPNGGTGGLADGSDLYEDIDKLEQHYQQKIADAIGFPNSLVSVSVDINTENVTQSSIKYDPKGSLQQTLSEKTQTDNSTNGSPASEPGVTPNTGMSVSSANAASNSTTSDHSETTYQNAQASTSETRVQPGGKFTVTSATVGLPRSAFLKEYKDKHPAESDPDAETLDKWATYQRDIVRTRVANSCGIKADDGRISVTIYSDSSADVAVAGMGGASTASAAMSVTGHLKEIAIGVLALMSLFMVSMIVRKGAPIGVGPSLAGVGGMSGPLSGFLEARSSVMGDDDGTPVVGGGRPAMDGVELDDDSYKAQQMVEQVTSMVQENPDGAAALVKRWLNKS